jgi:hypothetical protein
VLAEEVADSLRKVEPRLVPGADQAVAPLVLDDVLKPGQGGFGEPAEGVAVEVDEVVVGDDEAGAERGERVGGVAAAGVRAGEVDCLGCGRWGLLGGPVISLGRGGASSSERDGSLSGRPSRTG